MASGALVTALDVDIWVLGEAQVKLKLTGGALAASAKFMTVVSPSGPLPISYLYASNGGIEVLVGDTAGPMIP